jgi:trans-aconitate 2-methyltransferase
MWRRQNHLRDRTPHAQRVRGGGRCVQQHDRIGFSEDWTQSSVRGRRRSFDLVVSFNALHWIHEQDLVLTSIHRSLKPAATAHLRLVPMGARKSIETVLEETRNSPTWSKYFGEFRDPYLRLTQEEYCSLAQKSGFRIEHVQTQSKTWDFGTRAEFLAFSSVTMVEWTKRLPESLRSLFITDVLDRYQTVAADKPGKENAFKFYQMTIVLTALA